MKQRNQLVIQKLCPHFLKNEQGVYSVMMAGLSFVILAVIVFTVDGSGLFLDKARFSQGLEQGTLALVAENNKYRENKAHGDILRQNVGTFSSNAKKLSAQQEKRNKEILQDISRHYYYPSSYVAKGQTIEDSYSYECKDLAKGIACEVQGSFDRPSWLYGSNSQLSFAKTIQLTSDKMYAQKSILQGNSGSSTDENENKLALDVLFVLDMSASMNDGVNHRLWNAGRKIDMLIRVTNKLANSIFENNPFNRIGYVGFGWGARQTNNSGEKCVMPYEIDYAKAIKYGFRKSQDEYEKSKEIDYIGRDMPHYVDYEKTFNMVDRFDGKPISGFFKFANDRYRGNCMRKHFTDAVTTDLWFSKENSTHFYNSMKRLRYIEDEDDHGTAGTLSTSGLLVAANLILSKQGFHSYKERNNLVRRKVIIIVSDGIDEAPYFNSGVRDIVKTTNQFLVKGLCNRIRKRLNAEQSPLVAPAMIGYIALGYSPTNTKEWKDCTDDDFYVANSELSFSKAFNSIINKASSISIIQPVLPKKEEVGHSLDSKPKDWK